MKVAVISDTHIGKNLDRFSDFISNQLRDVDMIIHAGDYTSYEVVKILCESKKFIGVLGNNDDFEKSNFLNEIEIFNIENYKIGIFHGHGKKKTTFERVFDKFKNTGVDIVIFGHSHSPATFTKDKILFINPGSPCSKRRERWFSFVILSLNDNHISSELRFSESKLFD